METKENIARFEELMGKVERDGKDALMDYIRNKTDFYSAPASTKFHMSCCGGLLQHSLNVYDCLVAKKSSPIWKPVLEAVPEESLIIMALLHDLCKVNFYNASSKNQKSYDPAKIAKADRYSVKHDEKGDYVWESVPIYEIDDTMPLGHGEKSVMLINCFMRLNTFELFAIRWHMGFSEDRSQHQLIGNAIEKFPIVLALMEADLEASKIMEDTDGYKEIEVSA